VTSKHKTTSKNNDAVRKVASLFSGCGGMDLGFEGGFEVLRRSVCDRKDIVGNKRSSFVSIPKTSFRTSFHAT